MKLTDVVWVVNNAGESQQVPLSELVQDRSALPFFDTELEAVTEASARFTALASEYDAKKTAALSYKTTCDARIAELTP